ncbi:hypothetical protein [Egicoccus halophilus]|uniref:Uncharacterized protein n=1 Tax=Egicoccus halophilus TaxID=1670830 RepID=A0A8J3ET00_9ACTN|nr:hypothetical protein [Egicoccus halophilus]GGI04575.1 hypothetical protein GCM10011354_09780 [Egicoccus halophilus]
MGSERPRARRLVVDGADDLAVVGTDVFQHDLWELAATRDGSGEPFQLRVELHPVLPRSLRQARRVAVVGPHGHELGELPVETAEEWHTGLQLLASLVPPYVLACNAEAWHTDGAPGGPLQLTLHLDLEELARLTG